MFATSVVGATTFVSEAMSYTVLESGGRLRVVTQFSKAWIGHFRVAKPLSWPETLVGNRFLDHIKCRLELRFAAATSIGCNFNRICRQLHPEARLQFTPGIVHRANSRARQWLRKQPARTEIWRASLNPKRRQPSPPAERCPATSYAYGLYQVIGQARCHPHAIDAYLDAHRVSAAETWLAAFGDQRCAQFGAGAVRRNPVRREIAGAIPGVNLKAGFGMELPANPMSCSRWMCARTHSQPALMWSEKSDFRQSFPGATLAVATAESAIHAFGKIELRREGAATSPRRCTTLRR